MIGGTADKSSIKRTAFLVHAAGATAIPRQAVVHRLFYPAGHPADGNSLGSDNDILGSSATTFMTPVFTTILTVYTLRSSTALGHPKHLSLVYRRARKFAADLLSRFLTTFEKRTPCRMMML